MLGARLISIAIPVDMGVAQAQGETMSKQFEVTFLIDASRLTTITELVAGECTLLGMKEVEHKRKVKRGFVGGKRNKGISGEKLLLQTLKDRGPSQLSDVRLHFKNLGFAFATAASVASKAQRIGLVTWHAASQTYVISTKGLERLETL